MSFQIVQPSEYRHTRLRAAEITAEYDSLLAVGHDRRDTERIRLDDLAHRSTVVLASLARDFEAMTNAYGSFEAAVNAIVASNPEFGCMIERQLARQFAAQSSPAPASDDAPAGA
ncbi:MAG TPA: hypothetical protein VGG50_11440 [Streptosporangiaceae bacterium]|jgi:hypothetical protein